MASQKNPTMCEKCARTFVGHRGLSIHKSKSPDCKNYPKEAVVFIENETYYHPDFKSQEDHENQPEARLREEQQKAMTDPFPRTFGSSSIAGPNMRKTKFFKVCEFISFVFEMILLALFALPTLAWLMAGVPMFCYFLFVVYLCYYHTERIVRYVASNCRHLVDELNVIQQ